MADPSVNADTGERQNAAGWSVDDPSVLSGSVLSKGMGLVEERRKAGEGEVKALEEKGKAQEKYIDRGLHKLEEPQPAHAQLEKLKAAPNPEDYKKYSMEFLGAMTLVGAFASRKSRNVGNAALKAFTGAMTGWQQGNLEAYAQATKQWEENTKALIENNRIELERYREVIEDRSRSIDEIKLGLLLAGMKSDNQIMVQQGKIGNVEAQLSLINTLENTFAKVITSYNRFSKINGKTFQEAKAQIDVLNQDDGARWNELKPEDRIKWEGVAKAFDLPVNQPDPNALPRGWTQQQADFAADMYNLTGKTLPGYGNASVRAYITRHAADRAQQTGMSAGQVVAGQSDIRAMTNTLTQLEKQKASVESFERTTKKNGVYLEQLADKVDRTGVPVIERWLRAGRRNIEGDADVNNFNAQIQLYGNDVAKVITSPNLTGVLTDTARREAQGFLGGDITANMIHALVPLLNRDMDNRAASIDEEINAVRSRIGAGGAPATSIPTETRSGGAGAAPSSDKPRTVIQNGHTYQLQPDGSYQ